MTNTKLTVEQKQKLKMLRSDPDTQIFHFPDSRVCVGIRRAGEKMGQFSVAVCADTETKYRKKVGELLVRERFDYGVILPVVLGPHTPDDWGYSDERDYLYSVAESIASAVSGR